MARTGTNLTPFDERRELLLKALQSRHLDLANVSKGLGRNHAYLHQYIFKGKPRFLDEADRISLAESTGLTEDQLGRKVRKFGGKTEPAKVATFEKPRTRGDRVVMTEYRGPPVIERDATLIPVYSAAQGGRGHWLVHFEALEYRAPPEDLKGVRHAYGILIRGESMIPAYKPGEIAWIHPHRPARPGDDVILYHVPPHGEAEAIIKMLISFSQSDWRLRQYHPPRDFTESRKDWPICHLIVGKRNAG